ncbi:ComF family protein [Aminipila butyrica]|uniref:ComF family protein n=1 Tax=Aminipila butyrica TaxID=433296 RepID=A0A858BS84_9FIRM|nr:ComF family protein [Aminipila butyrica]QIB68202.1 ComF family protein [Aminipila butyrica]
MELDWGIGIRNVKEWLLDGLFPANIYCICCGNLIDKTRPYALCDSCLENLNWANARTCIKCGKVLNETDKRRLLDEIGQTHQLCDHCKQNRHFFERGFTCMQYSTMAKEMIHHFKFNGCAYMGDKLGKIMLDRIRLEQLSVDLVVAVPMHPKNRRKRGYNQSELLAKVVAEGLGVVYNSQVLIRRQYKAPMNKLGAEQRYANIQNAYALAGNAAFLQSKSVLLIDDIYTTGSTVDECSRLLKEAGAGVIYVLTLAAGAN